MAHVSIFGFSGGPVLPEGFTRHPVDPRHLLAGKTGLGMMDLKIYPTTGRGLVNRLLDKRT